MPFVPGVRDQRADIVSQGMSQIAEMNLRGAENASNALSKGISKAGDGLAEGLELAGKQWKETRFLQDTNAGQVAGFENLAKARPEVMAGVDLARILTEKNPVKQAAHLAVAQGMVHANLALAQRGQQEAMGRFTPSEEERKSMAAAGYQWAQQSQRGGTYVPLKPQTDASADPQPQYDEQGNLLGHNVNVGGRWKFVQAKPAGASAGNPLTQPSPDERAEMATRLRGEIAGLEKEVAAGNERFGPDFLPFAKPYADQLAERKQALAGLGVGDAGAQPVQPSGNPQFQEGKIYMQGGKKYRYQGGQFVPVQ